MLKKAKYNLHYFGTFIISVYIRTLIKNFLPVVAKVHIAFRRHNRLLHCSE